jgi:hypothetical protein
MDLHEFRFGGKLKIGDFILVAYTDRVYPGWYCGMGQNKSLQYYSVNEIIHKAEKYDDYLKDKNAVSKYTAANFKDGFTKKSLYKSYIITCNKSRVIKITRPEETLIEQDDIQDYQKSKQILINLGIIKN